MYTIYADGSPLYIPGVDEQQRALYTVTDPKLSLELNKAGSLTFTMPPGNVAYSALQKLKTVVQVFRDGAEVWRGRMLYSERDFWNQKAVYCEGELAFLNDYQQRPFEYTGSLEGFYRFLLGNYNAAVDSWKRFEPGIVTVVDTNDYVYRYKETNESTWNLLNDQLLDTHGGYLKVRVENGVRYLDYLAEPGEVSSQTIMFGENLLDFDEYITAEDVYTVIIPQGAQEEGSGTRVDITSVNGGKDYLVNETGVALFGHIEKTVQWDDVTLPSNLLAKAKAALDSAIEMAATLTVSAVDLHHVNVNTEALGLGDYIPCVSIPHGLDSKFLLSKMEIPLDTPGGESYTLGVVLAGITDAIISNSKASTDIASTAAGAAVTANAAATASAALADRVLTLEEETRSTTSLYGKSAAIIGDSLAYGNTLGPDAVWLHLLAQKYGMTEHNLGINGNTVAAYENPASTPMCERYTTVPESDYIILIGGANDWNQSIPIGEISDTVNTTFCGALNTIIDGLRAMYPKAKLLFMTNYQRYGTTKNGLAELDYVTAMLEVCAEKCVACFDNYHNSGLNFADANVSAWADEGMALNGTANKHISAEGYEWLLPRYEALLTEL